MTTLTLKYVSKSGIPLTKGTEHSAGFDLPIWDDSIGEGVELLPGQRRKFATGVHLEIPEGYYACSDSRSSTSKLGLDLLCRTIDSDYRGEIYVVFVNTGLSTVIIKNGAKMAQIMLLPVPKVETVEVSCVEELTNTVRGDKGFGSTGGNV